MKIFFASFMETENHGPGKKIAITTSKPDNFNVDLAWPQVTPPDSLIDKYKEMQKIDQQSATEFFVFSYQHQLDVFFTELKDHCDENSVIAQDILPLQDGDTILSWERSFRSNYRNSLAKHLINLGYDVCLK